MPSFGKRSTAQLYTVREDFQKVMIEAIKEFDFSITQGHRGEEEQNRYFREGTTTLKYPRSKHNKLPCDAVDTVPYPVDWKDTSRFYRLMAVMFRAANKVKIKIRSGGDWRRDGTLNNYKLKNGRKPLMDLPHFEYKGPADSNEIDRQETLAKIYDAKADELGRVA